MSHLSQHDHRNVSHVIPPNTDHPTATVAALPSRPTPIQQLLASSLFLAALTAIVYLNGNAFRAGYYSYFRTDSAMFPLDSAGTVSMGFRAWGEGFAAVVLTLFRSGAAHRIGIAMFLILAGFCYATLDHLIALRQRQLERDDSAPPEPNRSSISRWLRKCFGWTALFSVSGAIVCAALLATTLSFGLLILPFEQLGRYEAKHDAADQFKYRAQVSVKSPSGVGGIYRIISCGPQFCTLWGNEHATTVPVSVIVWAESPPPAR